MAEVVKEFKPSAHRDVPKHEIVPKDEVEGVLKKYNATFEQLPYILTTDPVVLELQAKPGDLIKIGRESKTAGSSVYFRLVVEG
ncbi:MAG TPA: DNA-directed RNA polymerase subunit H [Conexivisphaerales archaeon]|nr:DNA-directed RNA polymerase subunit H [Conexivisphaerales archaeon]